MKNLTDKLLGEINRCRPKLKGLIDQLGGLKPRFPASQKLHLTSASSVVKMNLSKYFLPLSPQWYAEERSHSI